MLEYPSVRLEGSVFFDELALFQDLPIIDGCDVPYSIIKIVYKQELFHVPRQINVM